MEANEIMTTENLEVMEELGNIEEIEAVSSGNGLKTVAKIGVIAGLGYLGYRFVVKPMVAKFKAKKEQAVDESDVIEVADTDVEVGEDDDRNVVGFDRRKK